MPDTDHFVTMEFPLRGVDTSMEFSRQPKLTGIHGINVRAQEPMGLRLRGGSRSGMVKYLPDVVNSNGGLNLQIQHLNFVVDPQGDALDTDTDSDEFDSKGRPRRYVNDPSTSNLKRRIPRTQTRRVRQGGSGRAPNIKFPKNDYKVFWDQPNRITVGAPLSAIQLNAMALTVGDGITLQQHMLPVPGTYTYNPAAGTVLPKGNNQTLLVTFAPSNQTVFKPKTKSVKITVENVVDTETVYFGAFSEQGQPAPPATTDEDYILVYRVVRYSGNLTTVENVTLGERLLEKFSDGIDPHLGSVELFIPENGQTSSHPGHDYGYQGNAGS